MSSSPQTMYVTAAYIARLCRPRPVQMGFRCDPAPEQGPWLTQSLAGGSAGLLRDGKTTTWEGGVREPGLAYWPGRISPGRISTAVVATYDIFVTAINLAGAKLPEVALDGRDMAPVLFNTSNDVSQHQCVFHWRGTPGLACPVGHPDCPGLWAVRCAQYKAHWVTKDSIGPERGIPKFYESEPLLFDVEVWPPIALPQAAPNRRAAQPRRAPDRLHLAASIDRLGRPVGDAPDLRSPITNPQ